jgi:serine/threonine protein phosphatase PrpC
VEGIDSNGGLLTALTLDHTLPIDCLQNGSTWAEVVALSQQHPTVVTRMLGHGLLHLEVEYLAAEKGDLFLLCTDGLTRQLSHDEVHSVLAEEGALEERCHRLVQATDAKGGVDNVTAILISYAINVMMLHERNAASPSMSEVRYTSDAKKAHFASGARYCVPKPNAQIPRKNRPATIATAKYPMSA